MFLWNGTESLFFKLKKNKISIRNRTEKKQTNKFPFFYNFLLYFYYLFYNFFCKHDQNNNFCFQLTTLSFWTFSFLSLVQLQSYLSLIFFFLLNLFTLSFSCSLDSCEVQISRPRDSMDFDYLRFLKLSIKELNNSNFNLKSIHLRPFKNV